MVISSHFHFFLSSFSSASVEIITKNIVYVWQSYYAKECDLCWWSNMHVYEMF